MGDPKHLKKKYFTPLHPWNKANIESERKIVDEYSLRNKKEIFVANSFLKKYKDIAKKLIAVRTKQGEKEKEQVLAKLQHLGFLPAGAGLDQILSLELKDVLERRFQSIVYRKGLAHSMKQARQFIIHRHMKIGDQEVSMPSYLVPIAKENIITFKVNSSLANEEHPERANKVQQEEIKEELNAIKKEQRKKVDDENLDVEIPNIIIPEKNESES